MDTEQPNLETSNNVQSKSLELREAERKREQEKRKRDAEASVNTRKFTNDAELLDKFENYVLQ